MEVHIDQSYSLRDLLQDVKDGVLRVDYLLQRDAEQWKPKDKSLLIDSVLRGIVIKPVTVMQKGTGDEACKFLTDGKQRVTTLAQFKNNEFKLSKSLKPIAIKVPKMVDKLDADGNPVMELLPGKKRRTIAQEPLFDDEGNKVYETVDYKLANKTYSELPKVLRDKFNRYNKMLVIRMIDCTPEQIRLQMIRDNISVRMNPAQIGTIVGGEEVARFTRSYREHDLFKSLSSWSENEIKKDAVERCVTESFVLSYMPDLWGGYDKNVSLFIDNATTEAFDEMSSLIDRLADVLRNAHIDKGNICAKNMYIILANFKAFVDMEEYDDAEYGKFLAEWFDSLKDTTEYTAFDVTSTKSKRIVLTRLDIMTEAMTEYLRENATVSDSDVDDDAFSETETDSEDMFTPVAEYENSLADILCLQEGAQTERFNTKALMVASDYHFGNFNDDTIEDFRRYFCGLSFKERNDVVEMAQLLSDCVNDRLSVVPYDSEFITPDNMLCLLMVEKRAQTEDVDHAMSDWLAEFTANYSSNGVYAHITDSQASYIIGRYSYLWNSFEQYLIQMENKEREVA